MIYQLCHHFLFACERDVRGHQVLFACECVPIPFGELHESAKAERCRCESETGIEECPKAIMKQIAEGITFRIFLRLSEAFNGRLTLLSACSLELPSSLPRWSCTSTAFKPMPRALADDENAQSSNVKTARGADGKDFIEGASANTPFLGVRAESAKVGLVCDTTCTQASKLPKFDRTKRWSDKSVAVSFALDRNSH